MPGSFGPVSVGVSGRSGGQMHVNLDPQLVGPPLPMETPPDGTPGFLETFLKTSTSRLRA